MEIPVNAFQLTCMCHQGPIRSYKHLHLHIHVKLTNWLRQFCPALFYLGRYKKEKGLVPLQANSSTETATCASRNWCMWMLGLQSKKTQGPQETQRKFDCTWVILGAFEAESRANQEFRIHKNFSLGFKTSFNLCQISLTSASSANQASKGTAAFASR